MIVRQNCATCGSENCKDPLQLVLWSELEYIQLKISKLTNTLLNYDEAARKFIQKCEVGRAKSVETLADLTKCLEHSEEAKR